MRLGVDAELVELQIEAGTADLSFGETVPMASLASLLTTADPTAWLSPSGGMYGGMHFLVLNHVGPNNGGALKRRDVRRAIAMAVDKAAIAQLAGGPAVARPLNQAVPSSGAGYRVRGDQAATPQDHGDPGGAARLLSEAGYPNGLSLTLAYPVYASLPIAAQSLQASLKRAGIALRLVPSTQGDFWGRLLPNPENARRGEWDLAITAWTPDWFGQNNGRSVIAPLFDGRRSDRTRRTMAATRAPRSIRRSIAPRRLHDEDAAEQAWVDAARHLMDDVAFVPLIEARSPYARSRRVRNCTWAALGLNCDLSSLWLADARPSGRRITMTPESAHTGVAPLLDVRDLRVAFRTPDGLLEAVSGLSFSVARGQVLGIVGESGSGKSVATQTMVGLTRGARVTGEALFEGQNLLAMSPDQLRAVRGRGIAMVFQNPLSSLHPLYRIGWQIVEMIQAHEQVTRAQARARAIELLGLVGIPHPDRRVDDYPHQFSGGMLQRALIAMALALQPRLLVADEPTTALDVTVQAQIIRLLRPRAAGIRHGDHPDHARPRHHR